MKYLVNRETKEHYIQPGMMVPYGPQYDEVEADADGWIPWSGGECPLPASNQAEVKLQDGKQGRFDSIPLMTHRSWQKWNCGGDIIAYRPILAEKEEISVVKESLATESVFDRLKSAIAASESIQDIIAEIDAMLPEGYCVVKRGAEQPAEHPAEGMTDWRNWREGDLVECISTDDDGAGGLIGIEIGDVLPITGISEKFGVRTSKYSWGKTKAYRFHSRPAKVTE